ncbi:MAG TPA: hypothetical protein VH763_05665 [Gemmatimonadales bacterium]|jgi:hypothetical protein
MRSQGDLPRGMACGALLEGLLAGYRYLGRYWWGSTSSASPRSPVGKERSEEPSFPLH